jgi:hypothetical protein
MTAASKEGPNVEVASLGILRAEPLKAEVRPMSIEKETGQCIGGAWRGRGPSAHTRIVEITSGRTISQQGLTATCKDPLNEGNQSRREGFGSGA